MKSGSIKKLSLRNFGQRHFCWVSYLPFVLYLQCANYASFLLSCHICAMRFFCYVLFCYASVLLWCAFCYESFLLCVILVIWHFCSVSFLICVIFPTYHFCYLSFFLRVILVIFRFCFMLSGLTMDKRGFYTKDDLKAT